MARLYDLCALAASPAKQSTLEKRRIALPMADKDDNPSPDQRRTCYGLLTKTGKLGRISPSIVDSLDLVDLLPFRGFLGQARAQGFATRYSFAIPIGVFQPRHVLQTPAFSALHYRHLGSATAGIRNAFLFRIVDPVAYRTNQCNDEA